MIQLRMTLGENYSLHLEADTMNEMIEKIIDWQDWDNTKNTLKSFGKSEEIIRREEASGWYYKKLQD